MKFSLLLVFAVALFCNGITAAVIEARGKHPNHPSSSSHHGRVNTCRDRLNGHPKAQARKFCRTFLNAPKPAAASTITQTTTTTPLTVTVSGTVVQTTLPDVYTTTTSVTTIQSTVTTPEARRRSQETSIVSLDKRGRFSQILKQFPKEVVTDACLLYLYGQIDALAVKTTTVVTAATSTSTSISTSVHTNPPTTTSTVTVSSTTTSYTSVAPAPTELVKTGGLETTELGDGPRFNNVAAGDWTLEGSSSVKEDVTLAASGKRFLSLLPTSSTGTTTYGAARVNFEGMVIGKTYTVTYKRRFVSINTLYPDEAYCDSYVSLSMPSGTGGVTDYESLTVVGSNYVVRTFQFTATATFGQLRPAVVAFYGTTCVMYYDDFSILRSS